MSGDGNPVGELARALDWPDVEFDEIAKETRVTAELPGLNEKDVNLIVEDDALTLRGEIQRGAGLFGAQLWRAWNAASDCRAGSARLGQRHLSH